MAIITPQQLGFLMESVIEDISKEFVSNLERFGFVPAGPGFKVERFENKGTPNSPRMSSVSGMIYRAIFSCYTRSINGMESRKVFSSLSLSDNLNYQPQPQQSSGWMGKMFGR